MSPVAANLSAVYTVMPLVIALLLLVSRAKEFGNESVRHRLVGCAFLVGLLAGAACTLKNTFIPFVGLVTTGALVFLGFAARRARTPMWLVLVAIGFGLIILLLPWMLDLRRSSGTPLYPLLGRGFHGSVYGLFPTPSVGFLSPNRIASSLGSLATAVVHLLFLCNVALATVCAWTWRSDDSRGRLVLLTSVAALLTTGVIWVGTGGWGTYRYSAPVLLSAVMASLFILQARREGSEVRRYVVWGIALLIAGYGWSQFEEGLKPGATAVSRSISGQNLYTRNELDAYKRLSDAIPLDGGVLARVSMPFILKQRPDLFIADYPGGASPPPGLPVGDTPDTLVRYLREKKIRYVIWDHEREASFSWAAFSKRLDVGEHPWVRAEAAATFDFQRQLDRLRREYPVVYDADGLAVMDLLEQSAK